MQRDYGGIKMDSQFPKTGSKILEVGYPVFADLMVRLCGCYACEWKIERKEFYSRIFKH